MDSAAVSPFVPRVGLSEHGLQKLLERTSQPAKISGIPSHARSFMYAVKQYYDRVALSQTRPNFGASSHPLTWRVLLWTGIALPGKRSSPKAGSSYPRVLSYRPGANWCALEKLFESKTASSRSASSRATRWKLLRCTTPRQGVSWQVQAQPDQSQ